ncbi:MAG: hypothetical protein CMJ18_02810 [Phycisphaeraceae bacterium]|nr:hypothetical protein [Phycisphaeraceae bacterium]
MRLEKTFFVLAMTACLMQAPSSADELDDQILFGIRRSDGSLSRFDFTAERLSSVGTIRIDGGDAVTDIDGSAYIPGHRNIIGLWTDPSDSLSKLVYINTETAAASIVGQDLGPGRFTGATSANGPVHGQLTSFQGDEHAVIEHSTGYLLNAGTIMFSFRADDVDRLQGLFSKDSSGYDHGGHVHIYLQDGHVKVRLQSHNHSHYISSSSPIAARTWYHAAFTFGSGGMKLYLNGSLVAQADYNGGLGTSSGGSGNTEPIALGASTVTSGNGSVTPLKDFFTGQIGDVRIEDRAMPAQDIAAAGMSTTGWMVYGVQTVETTEETPVAFAIEDDSVVPAEPFAVKITVLGAALHSGSYHMPVTLKTKINESVHTPFGPFHLAVSGNVNDENNPRHHVFSDTYPAGTRVDIIGRSHRKKKSWYSGSNDLHFRRFITVDGSSTNVSGVIVLRNGSEVPDIDGYANQANVEDFVRDYIDDDTDKIVLDENQVIFLFELGTTNMGSIYADFQDLVVLVTLARDPGDFDEDDDDDGDEGAASRLLKVNHATGGYEQLMTLDRVYDGLATTDGVVFHATMGRELWEINLSEQTETLVGTSSEDQILGLEFTASTLRGFENVANELIALDLSTAGNLITPLVTSLTDLGSIIFMPRDQDPSVKPKSYD